MFAGVAVALPAMGAELGAGATSLGLVETLFLAGSVAFLLPVGRLADAADKATLYKLGLLGFGVSSILIGLLSSVPAILCLRFLQGLGSAVFAATGPALLADVVPAAQRGRAYGASLAAVYVGLTLGPIAAGLLIDLWSWRAVFYVGAAVILLGLVLIQALLPSRWRRPEPGTVHLPSVGLVVTSVLCLVAGSAWLRLGAVGYAGLGTGVLLGALFVGWQPRLPRPLLDVGALLRNRPLRGALSVQLLLYMNAFAAMFMLSIYIQVSLDRSAATAGQVLALATVVMAAVAPFAGALADRLRPSRVATVGVAWIVVASALATTLDEDSSLTEVVLMLMAQGLGFGFFSSPNMTTIMNSVPPERTSMVSALGAKARSLGMIAGMLVAAILISLELGEAPVAADPARFVDVMHRVFSVLVLTASLALVVCVLGARGAREPAPSVE
jgi:MFS family permease